jgi:hypothetical protein
MDYEARSISFLEREDRVKHYGIARHDRAPRPALVAATREAARAAIPPGALGFTITHDAVTAGLGLVYWWANENEIHARFFAAPREEPGALGPYDGTGMSCVWELEVIDFERRAYLDDVLKEGDVEAYLERALEPVEV